MAQIQLENQSLRAEFDFKSGKIEEFETMNQGLVDFIKMQADEIARLEGELRGAACEASKLEKENGELLVRPRSLQETNQEAVELCEKQGAEAISECSERQVKELYDTITEVFIERIEELKSEVDELRAENRQLRTSGVAGGSVSFG